MIDDRPLRILQLTNASAYGGLSRHLFDLARGLSARGHEVTIAGARGAWHDLFERAGIRWLEVPLDGGVFALYRSYRAIVREMEGRGLHVVHAHYRRSMLVARRLARRFGVPCVSTRHAIHMRMSGLHRSLTHHGDHVVAPSAVARRWLIDRAGIAPGDITVIPNCVDIERFPLASEEDRRRARVQLGLPEDATVAGFVGRFAPVKQAIWVLDVLEAMRDDHPELVAVFMGGGVEESALRARAAASGVEERVRFLPYGDPLPVYQAADVVLLPSRVEVCALSPPEAMCVGRAVLRTDTGGAAEQVVAGGMGVVPVDRGAFIAAAREMLADRAALRRMGAAGAEQARREFTLDRQVDATVQMYRLLIRPPASGPA